MTEFISNIIKMVINMIYRRIKDLREDKDYTQQRLANILCISRSAYSAYENGANSFPIDILIKLSKIYNTSIDYLLEQTDKPDAYPRKK
ncbi:MAG: helix-turn-helix transcriptional regulator [Hydrogenoanaerobacterium sp.]